jgi:hypothetical protein
MKVIMWLGLSGILVAGGFWLAGGLAGDWLNDWLVPLVVLVLLGLPSAVGRALSGAAGGVSKEFLGAPIGIGTVTGVARTGLSVNDQPQLDIRLRVDTADGRTFPASMRQVVDVTDLSAVQPNAMLPVRYLADGRVALATDAPTHELQAALDRVHIAKGWLTPKQLRITEYGVDASAVVVSMTPTGHTEDGRSKVRLRVLVTRPDSTTFEATQDKNLPPTSVPQVQPGMVVRVKYLPHDESDVAVLTTLAP